MKILHLSKEAGLGGAGIAAYRLHKGLRALGAESLMLVNKAGQADETVLAPATTADKVAARLTPLLDRLPGRLAGQDSDRVSASWVPDNLRRRIRGVQPDILNLHWVNDGFMRIETLPRLEQPVVWTLHDMWAFAGGEHYVGESGRYREGYSAGNRPAGARGWDVDRWIWHRKQKAWSALRNMVIVTPSRWLGQCVRESRLFGGLRVEVLPNGVDHERFHPIPHETARQILGLPVDKKLVLFGAGSATSDRRKGFHLLLEALQKLSDSADRGDYELVVFGGSAGADLCALKTHYLGHLHDEISMALVYAAADVFVAPSLEDNLPNTVLEAMACGTPVVAFDIGGMPDMVSHQATGFLAKGFETDELASGLMWVLADGERWQTLSRAARGAVEGGYTLEAAARRYLDLYSDMVSIAG